MTKRKAARPLSDDAILSRLNPILRKAMDGSIERNSRFENCLALYNRDPFPYDEDIASSKSRFVSSDVFEHVEMLNSQLLSIFEGQEDVVTYIPRGPEDEALANQQTQIINWVLRDDNELTTFLDDWFKTGLIYGSALVYAEHYGETVWLPAETLEGVPVELLSEIADDDSVEIVELGDPYEVADEAGLPVVLRDASLARSQRKSGVRLRVLRPEDVILSHDAAFSYATGGIDAGLQGFRSTMTRRELVEMGYDEAVIDSIPAATESFEDLSDHRNRMSADHDEIGAVEPEVTVWEVFVRMDIGGTGKAPLVHFTLAGEDGGERVLLDKREVEMAPFAAFVPIKDPHTLYGKGIADIIGRDQRYKSRLYRAQEDNLHSILNPRPLLDTSIDINIDDVFNDEVGAPIRYDGQSGGQPIGFHSPPQVGQNALQAIDRLDMDIEKRTGIGANTMALDPSDLKRTTATASTQRLSSAMLRTDKMARLFAGTGYRYLFRAIGSILANHPEDATAIIERLSLPHGVAPMSANAWDTSLDVRPNVSFGNTDKVTKTNALMNILALQKEAMAAELPYVRPQHLHHTVAEIIQLHGFRNTSLFMDDPRKMAAEGAEPEAEQPDPELQAKMAEMQMKLQFKQMELAQEKELALAKLAMEREVRMFEAQLKYQTGQQEMGAEIMLQGAKLEAGARPQDNIPNPYKR